MRTNIKKFQQQDRYGNMMSFELFEPQDGIPPVSEIPKPEGINFKPKGTDTVPAMLTPGENVVNAEASRLPGNQQAIDQMNNQGRVIQKQQGGPIPSYRSEGGKIPMYSASGDFVNNELLDSLRKVESNGDNNALSEAGALGPYQIMKATAEQPGYGVAAMNPNDRTDPIKSREFTRKYLLGLIKQYPQMNEEQILQAYHSGAGNVLKSMSGEEELGVRGKAYGQKVLDGVAPQVVASNNSVVYNDGSGTTPDFLERIGLISSAQASTDEKVPEVDTGNWYDSLRRVPGNISDLFGDINDKFKSQEKNEDKFYEFYEARNELENINQDINLTNEELKTADDNQKIRLNEKLKELNKRKAELNIEVPKLGSEYKKLPKGEGSSLQSGFDTPIIGSDTTINVDEDTESVDLKPNDVEKEKKVIATGILKLIKDIPKKDQGKVNDKLVDGKLPDVDPSIADQAVGFFKDMFQDAFDGKELARLAMSYTATRMLGFDHGNSLEYATKDYIKRVDADIAARETFITKKDNLARFTTKSLEDYRRSGNLTDLKEKSGGINAATGIGPMIYHNKFGPLTTVKVGKDKYEIIYKGQQYPFNHSAMVGQVNVYKDELHEPQKVGNFFLKRGKAAIDKYNSGKEQAEQIAIDGVNTSNDAATAYLEDAKLFASDSSARNALRTQMVKAQDEYWTAYGLYKDGNGTKPNSVLSFYNKRAIVFKSERAVSGEDFKGASAEKVLQIDKQLLNIVNAPDVANKAEAYKMLWGSFKKSWTKNNKGSQYENIMSDKDGNNSFTYWVQQVLAGDKEAEKLLTEKG